MAYEESLISPTISPLCGKMTQKPAQRLLTGTFSRKADKGVVYPFNRSTDVFLASFLHRIILIICLLSVFSLGTYAQFPEIGGTNSSASNLTGIHNVSLPANIQSGDLLLIFWTDTRWYNSNVNVPAGWTQLYNAINPFARYVIMYRIADGTEGPILVVTTSSQDRSAHTSYKINAGTYVGVPVHNSTISGSPNVAPDPPLLAPGFADNHILWIAAAYCDGVSSVVSYPPNYTDPESGYTGFTGSQHARMSTASRQLFAPSENPGNFIMFATVYWGASTVAIAGACVNATLTLTSPAGTDNQAICFNEAIDNIVYSVGGSATGATVSGLPAGVTGVYSNGTFTISGTPTQTGTFNYTVTTTGVVAPCTEATATGTIVVNPLPACSIAGNGGPLCPSAVEIYSAPGGMSGYSWSISGNGSITAGANSQAVTVTAGAACGSSFTLNLSITNASGCSSSCNLTVMVDDNTNPTISCPGNQSRNADAGQCYYAASGAEFDPTGYNDNCNGYSVSNNYNGLSTLDGETFPVGSTTVTWTITDACSNTATCSLIITVVDTQDPVITCPTPSNPYFTDAGDCYATLTLEANATDNCPGTAFVYTIGGSPITFPYPFPVGTTTVTATATDASGNTDVCTYDVQVVDDEDPTITCPTPANSYSTDPGDCDATLSFAATPGDNCGVASLVYTISGTPITFPYVFPVGTTTVLATVTDVNGNTGSCSFNVVVEDNELPAISCPADVVVGADAGECYATNPALGTATATDNCGIQSIGNNFSVLFPSGQVPAGVHTITWTATDIHGNTQSCGQLLTVVDSEDPVILDCPVDITEYTGPGAATCDKVVTWTPPTATDNCDNNVSLTSTHAPGSIFPVGTTTVTYTATDDSGNQSFCSFDVTVIDNTNPTFTQPPNITIYVNNSCSYNAAVSITGDVTNESDNCTLVGLQATYSDNTVPGPCPGTFVITRTWSLTDIHGNTVTKNQIITVADNIKPVLNEPPDIIIECDESTLPGNTGNATGSDNCGGPVTFTYVDVIVPLPCPNEYDIQRTWTATDCPGNTSSDLQVIYVRDNTGPTILSTNDTTVQCPADVPPQSSSNIIAVDNCGAIDSIVFFDEIPYGLDNQPGYCPDSIHRVYRVYDICGNYTVAIRRIIILDECDCSPCADTLSFYTVDLDGDPTGDTTIYQVERLDKCCDATNDYCASFNIRIDDDAVGVQILIDGASPDPHDWKIDCEAVEIYGDIICIPGGMFHLFTYCKPGANKNNFTFQSIAGIILAEELVTRVNCDIELLVEGEVSNPVWNSVWPGVYGQYNNYLSCTNCLDPTFMPDELSPPEIHYQVCADLVPGPCNPAGASCDTAVVFVLDSISVVFDVDPGAYCQDEIPMICATVNPPGSYTYEWYDSYDSTGNLVGTDPCYQPLVAGQYSLVVTSMDEEVPCSTYLYNFDVAPDDSPPVVYPPEDLFLECADPDNPQLIQDWLALAYAIDDNTPDVAVENDFSGIAEYCNSTVLVTFTAMDSCENVGTATATITIIDTIPPTITCPDSVTVEADPVTCEVADPDIGWPEYGDECPGVVAITSNAPAAFPPGETIVTWYATDECGNVDSCTQVVTVVDLEPPDVECPVDVLVNAEDDLCEAFVNVPAPVVTDPCPYTLVNDYTGTDDASGVYNVGITTVTWTITGVSNNISHCTQTVTVIDNQPPTITCPPDASAIAEPPECEVPGLEIGDPVYNDNCPDPLLFWIKTGATTGSGSGLVDTTTFNVGVTVVNYIVADTSGNTDTCSFTVTIYDEVPPTIIYCPPDTTVTAGVDSCEVYITVPQPVVVDSCGEIVSISHDSPYGIAPDDASGTYPTGVHNVTWTFTDESNNTAECIQVITVIDEQPPSITCPPDVTAIAAPPECEVPSIVVDDPVYSDNCPGAVLSWVKSGATIGTGMGLVNNTPFNVGVTQVTYIITDTYGNADSCDFYVTVLDEVPPTIIECPPDTTVYVASDSCEAYVEVPAPVVEDPCGEIVSISHDSPYGISPEDASGVYPAGSHTITWTFTDESNNTSECTQIITILDTISPEITCPPDVFAIADPPDCEVPDIIVEDPVYSDNCPDPVLSWIKTGATTGSGFGLVNNTTFNVGVTTVTYIITDDSGNDDSCQFLVTVNDQVPPTVIACPPDTTVVAGPDSCSAYIEIPQPIVEDPCGEIVTYYHDSPYGISPDTASGVYPVGFYIITWIFEDESGNTEGCIQTVEVLDTIHPLLICPDDFEWPADFNELFATNVPVDTAVYSDNCGVETLTWEMSGATLGSSPLTGINLLTLIDTLFLGETTITYTATDSSGNVSTCSFVITISSKPEIVCPNDTVVFTDPGVCTATLDPGEPVLISGAEPITWTWEMTGATTDNGTGVPITPNPYTFNLGITTITWIATNISGADTCIQTIEVIDTELPTFETQGPFEFCVYGIFTATYNGLPEPDADIIPDRPDYYTIDGTTELDLINLADNCCPEDSLTIHWIINFSNGYPPVSGTGQPSGYGEIQLWGTTDYTIVVHTITYWIEDCHGNATEPMTEDITILPRPSVIKQY